MLLFTALSFFYAGLMLILLDSLTSQLFESRKEGASFVLFFGVKVVTVFGLALSVLCLIAMCCVVVAMSVFSLFQVFFWK